MLEDLCFQISLIAIRNVFYFESTNMCRGFYILLKFSLTYTQFEWQQYIC